MPNSEWYRKNRADIIDLIPSVMNYMLDNDMLMNQYQDQTVQSVVDMAAALVAEVDQRGIAPMSPEHAAQLALARGMQNVPQWTNKEDYT